MATEDRIREGLEEFIFPEGKLSLKLIFDNLRNYLICAALYGIAIWMEKGAPGLTWGRYMGLATAIVNVSLPLLVTTTKLFAMLLWMGNYIQTLRYVQVAQALFLKFWRPSVVIKKLDLPKPARIVVFVFFVFVALIFLIASMATFVFLVAPFALWALGAGGAKPL